MQCDVLVVGAGPAGSSTANHLARRGFSVVLADKKAFPRAKPCGEFLSPQCVPFLAELGVEATVRELGPRLVRGMQLHGLGERALGRFRRLAGHPEWETAGFGVRRDRFDEALRLGAVAAGAQWLPRHGFVHLLRDAGGRIAGARLRDAGGVPVDVYARQVVAADGVHSRIARELGVQRPVPWLDQFALVAHYRGVPAAPCAEVHLIPGGFFAATTVDGDLFSLNLVVPRSTLRDRQGLDHDGFVARHLAFAPALAERLRGAVREAPWRGVGPLAHTTSRQVFDGVALVGDAAGYVDPLTGEGIYFSLFGARSLATAIEGALADPAAAHRAFAGHLADRRRELAPRMAASRWLQRALRHPWLVRRFLRAADRWPTLADLVVTLTGDTIHPRDLLRPSFWRNFRAATA